jgi:hypothetical protein
MIQKNIDWKKVNVELFAGIYLMSIFAGFCLVVGVSPVVPIFLLLVFESVLFLGMAIPDIQAMRNESKEEEVPV